MGFAKSLFMESVNKENAVLIRMINPKLKHAKNFKPLDHAHMDKDAILVMILKYA